MIQSGTGLNTSLNTWSISLYCCRNSEAILIRIVAPDKHAVLQHHSCYNVVRRKQFSFLINVQTTLLLFCRVTWCVNTIVTMFTLTMTLCTYYKITYYASSFIKVKWVVHWMCCRKAGDKFGDIAHWETRRWKNNVIK